MAEYVIVPASAIFSYLESLGFEKSRSGNEVVFLRRSRRNSDVMIKVYTSVRCGDSIARPSGRDSLRVVVVFDSGRKNFGIGKFSPIPRVHSVESVLRRLRERLGEAAGRAQEWMDGDDARQCARGNQRELHSRLAEKAEFAAWEAEQERAGFESDPDYLAMLEAG